MKTEFQNGVLTAYLEGEIDHDSAAGIRAQVDASAQSLKPSLLRLDFSRVGFMDSSGAVCCTSSIFPTACTAFSRCRDWKDWGC